MRKSSPASNHYALITSLVLGGLWTIIPEKTQISSLGGSTDGIEHPMQAFSRIGHVIQKIKQSGDSSNHQISKNQQYINHFALIPSLVLGGMWTIIIFLKA